MLKPTCRNISNINIIQSEIGVNFGKRNRSSRPVCRSRRRINWNQASYDRPEHQIDSDQPLPTISAGGGHIGIVEPFVFNIGQYSAKDRSRSIHKPLTTIVTKAEHCLVTPFIVKYYGTANTQGIDCPLDTITTKERFALIDGDTSQLDIRFRMLRSSELSRAQGFPDNYMFAGNNKEIVKQIGNAVPPHLARAIVAA